MRQILLRFLVLSAPFVLLGTTLGTAYGDCLSHRVLVSQRDEARLVPIAQTPDVPVLDTTPTCAGVASIGSNDRTVADCQRSEKEARDELKSRWTQFPRNDQRSCVEGTRIGGFPSYVQVLACLEIARDPRDLRVMDTPKPQRAVQGE